jgi:hypothetical protein
LDHVTENRTMRRTKEAKHDTFCELDTTAGEIEIKFVNYTLIVMNVSLCSGAEAGRANMPRRYAYAVGAGELQASGDDVCGEVARNNKLLFEVALSHFTRTTRFACRIRCLNRLRGSCTCGLGRPQNQRLPSPGRQMRVHVRTHRGRLRILPWLFLHTWLPGLFLSSLLMLRYTSRGLGLASPNAEKLA